MADFLVGNAATGSSFRVVSRALLSDESSESMVRKWKAVAEEVGLSRTKIAELEQQLRNDLSLDTEELYIKILEHFRMKKGNGATLGQLYLHLQNLELNQAAEQLRRFELPQEPLDLCYKSDSVEHGL